MAARKLNVLVYTGGGTTVESAKHCLYSLRRLLSPNYAVIPVTENVLLKEPWAPSCALLVFPGGADMGYCKTFNGDGNRKMADYVRRGGAYLGFCAGGYYGSTRCEFEVGNEALEVVGRRELGFFPGTCRGGAFKGFAYFSEAGARAVKLIASSDAFPAGALPVGGIVSYYNGGGVFVDAEKMGEKGVEVLATYEGDLDVDAGKGKAAVVFCKVGDGMALLTGPHPEFSPVNLKPQPDIPDYDELLQQLTAYERSRTTFLRACLAKLGLDVDPNPAMIPSLSSLHLSSMQHSEVSELLFSWEEIMTKEGGEEYVKAENDLFHVEKRESRWNHSPTLPKSFAISGTDGEMDQDRIVDFATVVKRIIPHDESWPEAKTTPNFHHGVFYSSLKEYRQVEGDAEEWGSILMYGEVLTSTNTILDKNPKLLSKLPTGFTVAATTQVAGRGRGTNVWVSPAGCLIMSTVINHPAHLAASRPIVFIQYLAAISIVDAIHSYGNGYGDLPVKIKWPNDIYARDPKKPAEPPSYVKIGGILANCAYSAGNYQIVLGIGINTTNGRPTTSLDALLPSHLQSFRIERLMARILTRLESLYNTFKRDGFTAKLEERYYRHWLHSGQEVTLETEGNVRARVLGITRDWGMLKAEELDAKGDRTGRVWALQSDENSFDFWTGLLKRKT